MLSFYTKQYMSAIKTVVFKCSNEYAQGLSETGELLTILEEDKAARIKCKL